MEARTLTIVLPAYNELERIGPALDELFGYLRRRGQLARDGAPGAGRLPESIHVLVVDDGSADDTAALVQARPEAVAAGDGQPDPPQLTLLSVPHGGKGAAVRAGMLASTSELIVFADADMATPPDQIPLIVEALVDHDVALGSRIQPDGSDMRGSQPLYRRLLGRAFQPSPACGSSATSRTPSAASRDSPAPPPTTCSPTSGSRASSSTSSSSTSPGGGAIGSPSCRSAGPIAADRACGPRRASPCGSASTVIRIPLLHRRMRRAAVDPRPGLDR